MAQGQVLKDLPTDVILNISSFLLGSPAEMRLKHTKAFKQIQQRYRLKVVNTEVVYESSGSELKEQTTITLKSKSQSIQKVIQSLIKKLNLIKSKMDYTYNFLGYNIYIRESNSRGYDTGYVIIKNGDNTIGNLNSLEKIMTKKLKDIPKTLQRCNFNRIDEIVLTINRETNI